MTVNAKADFDAVGGKTISPSKLAHVVLRTANYETMRDFYLTFLGGHVTSEAPGKLSFITYDDEHHRVALVNMPDLGEQHKKNNGFEHMAFTFDSLDKLLIAYRQRKAHGIVPVWSVNHGPTTSLYYEDPDKNTIETQYDNLSSEESMAYMQTPEFAENPIGVDFDPEELIEKIKRGDSLKSLITRPNIGKRNTSSIPMLADAGRTLQL